MHGPLKNLPKWPASTDGVAVLAVSPDHKDHVSLYSIFSHTRWQLFAARNCQEAMSFLEQNMVGVLICEASLPDGSWRELLDRVSESPASPLLIVTSRNANDALWAEALNLGAYDVVSKPFERTEVTRIVSLAWLYWKEQMALRAVRKADPAWEADASGLRMSSATA